MEQTYIENMSGIQSSIWVFGYGSLIWKPDMQYKSKKIGYINGYQRRFWQRNATHRGTEIRFGRVATLVKSGESDKVWGVAYEIEKDIQNIIESLNKREKKLGGYTTIEENFFPRNGQDDQPRTVLAYIAKKDNTLYHEEYNMEKLAKEVVAAKGSAGTNIEYVLRLADYVRKNIPEDSDEHLFTLEDHVKRLTSPNTEPFQLLAKL